MSAKNPPRPPRRRPPQRGGVGDDNYFYEGWRDAGQGENRPVDIVHDPNCPPKPPAGTDDCGRVKLNFVKFPAFNQPPFFAKPLIKARSSLVIAAGATALIFDREIADRQRAIASFLGLDVAPIAPLLNSQLEFWFQLGKRGVAAPSQTILPVWDDQNPTGYGGSTPIQTGRTTVWPGVATPLKFFEAGMQFGIRGRAQFQGLIENKSAVPITVRGVFGYYYYWAEKASEFESGDFQS